MHVDSKALGGHGTDDQKARILTRANNLQRKIQSWITVQEIYMPSAQLIRHRTAEASNSSITPPIEVDAIPLLLPSAIPTNEICDRRLRRIEWRLRCAQASDGLDDLRRYLRLRSYLYIDKDRFQRGQRNNTRSKTFIQRVEVKVKGAAAKYRAAREAILNLAETLNVSDWDKTYPVLKDSDIRGLRPEEFNGSEGRRTVSWVWGNLGDGARSIDSADLKDCMSPLNREPILLLTPFLSASDRMVQGSGSRDALAGGGHPSSGRDAPGQGLSDDASRSLG